MKKLFLICMIALLSSCEKVYFSKNEPLNELSFFGKYFLEFQDYHLTEFAMIGQGNGFYYLYIGNSWPYCTYYTQETPVLPGHNRLLEISIYNLNKQKQMPKSATFENDVLELEPESFVEITNINDLETYVEGVFELVFMENGKKMKISNGYFKAKKNF